MLDLATPVIRYLLEPILLDCERGSGIRYYQPPAMLSIIKRITLCNCASQRVANHYYDIQLKR